MADATVKELDTAYFTRQIFWNSFWVFMSYVAFCCTYSLNMEIFLNTDISVFHKGV